MTKKSIKGAIGGELIELHHSSFWHWSGKLKRWLFQSEGALNDRESTIREFSQKGIDEIKCSEVTRMMQLLTSKVLESSQLHIPIISTLN